MPAMSETVQNPKNHSASRLDRFFKLSERNTSVGQEFRGGLVTFITMAYILVLNPVVMQFFNSYSSRS